MLFHPLIFIFWIYFIRDLHCTPVWKLEISCSFKMLCHFFAMMSHAALFLLPLIGKLSLHICKRKFVSASDQLEHRFRLTGPLVGLLSLLSPVHWRDAAGINYRAIVFKTHENKWGPGQGTEGSNEAGGIVNQKGKVLWVNSSAIWKGLFAKWTTRWATASG